MDTIEERALVIVREKKEEEGDLPTVRDLVQILRSEGFNGTDVRPKIMLLIERGILKLGWDNKLRLSTST